MLESIQTSVIETSHPILLAVLIGLGVFMLAGLALYIVEDIVNAEQVDELGEVQEADAAAKKKAAKSTSSYGH